MKQKQMSAAKKLGILFLVIAFVFAAVNLFWLFGIGLRYNGYTDKLESYKSTFERFVGPTKVLACGNTLQVNDYSKYDWTLFDPVAKKLHHDTTFDTYLEKAFRIGKTLPAR